MKQATVAGLTFVAKKTTKREKFLAEVDKVVPWSWLQALIEPCYQKVGNGRPPLRKGAIMDAVIIAAPLSARNTERKRDPEMRSTRKCNNWHFGMKVHIGVGARGEPVVYGEGV